jgi:hypothetical protein
VEIRSQARRPRDPNSAFAPESVRRMAVIRMKKAASMLDVQGCPNSEREEIAARIETFKATQRRFQQERDEFFATTLQAARQSQKVRHMA